MIFGTMPITAKFGNIGFTVFLGVGFNKGMLFQKYNSSRRGRDKYLRSLYPRGTVEVPSHYFGTKLGNLKLMFDYIVF